MAITQFKVNFRDIVTQLSPEFFREPIYTTWIYALIKPLDEVNDNATPIQFFNQKGVSFYQFTRFITRFLQVDSTTLKLQKYLNELFDSSNEGILIVNNNFPLNVEYLFNAEEQSVVNYSYNAWDATVDYAATGEFVLSTDGNVYESNTTPNVNNLPPSAEWDLISTADEYVFNEVDIYSADYTIKIPVLVTQQPGYSNELFQSIVNNFNAAGKSYEGIVLETSAFLFNKV